MRTHFSFVALFLLSLSACATPPTPAAKQTELLDAVNAGNIARVKALLRAGANVNKFQPPLQLTPLLVAAESGTADMVALLIAHKADVNAQDRVGETALMKAIAQRNLPMVEMLLDAGADINAKNQRGHTALTNAVLRSEPDILKVLIARGAEVEVVAAMGTTTWSMAEHMREAALKMPERDATHVHGAHGVAHAMRTKDEALAQTEAVLKLLSAAGAKRSQQTVKNFDAMDYHHH